MPLTADAEAAIVFFVETYGIKCDKAVAKLVKGRDVLLAFYDFPAEHWRQIRTSNPIESTFATVRHRTARTKGCLSPKNWSRYGLLADDVSAGEMTTTTAPITCRNSSRGLPSRTGSSHYQLPSDHAVTNFWA